MTNPITLNEPTQPDPLIDFVLSLSFGQTSPLSVLKFQMMPITKRQAKA
jgi:hypothetical protein